MPADPPDALRPVQGLDRGSLDQRVGGRRWLYGVTTFLLVALMALAVLDAARVVSAFGVDSAETSATGGGYRLEVRYTSVTRPALASPFEIEVHRPGGFDGPVTVAVDQAYLTLWDVNGVVPAPSGETTAGSWVLWEIDPPESEVLRITYDGRIEPGVQSGRDGRVAVFEGGRPVVEVGFTTRILP